MKQNNDGTCPNPMWSAEDEAVSWAMFAVFSVILTIGWAFCLVALWSNR